MIVLDITQLDFDKIISEWENNFIDFKSYKIDIKDLLKTIIAFTNTEGWKIYVWISENK